METIKSLIQAVEKVSDDQLRCEMLGKVTEVRDTFVRTHEQLEAKQAEIDDLRTHMAGCRHHGSGGSAIMYDPPM